MTIVDPELVHQADGLAAQLRVKAYVSFALLCYCAICTAFSMYY